MASIKCGTCSWNYDSWLGLVYTKKSPKAAGYLREYSKKYRTVEIDSWFYKIPPPKDIIEYSEQVDDDFSFTCKVTQDITLTHLRNFKQPKKELTPNNSFLSVDLFNEYINAITPLLPQMDAIMLEFEYLNKKKMESLDIFLKHLDTFLSKIHINIPLAVETRNSNYIKPEYFQFLKDKNIIHVFSEKIYMPHIYEVYEKFHDYIGDTTVIRLLGGDRKEMEELTKNKWDKIVSKKNDINKVIEMVSDMYRKNKKITINVNNHYEGSAPITIANLETLFNELL